MRRAAAAPIALAVLLAFAGAPLLHVHAAERHGHDGLPLHNHEAVIHTHLPSAPAATHPDDHHGAELSGAAGHDAKPLNVLAAVRNVPRFAVPFLPAARVELATGTSSASRVAPQSAPRAHDPPLVDRANPRAPPA